MRNQYIIAGPFVDDEALFWNNDTGWGSFQTAERFDRSIFITPLPLESVGLWELTDSGDCVNFYAVDSLPEWGMDWVPSL